MRKATFWPPFLLLLVGVIANLLGGADLAKWLEQATKSSVSATSPLLIATGAGAMICCLMVIAFPFGAERLGGEEAEHVLKPPQYFMVTLCTTVAAGILFWATAEPLYHLDDPPLGIEPRSEAAARFSMATLLLHWTLVPYAIYAVPAILFAYSFYNLGRPFRLSSCLYPLLGEKAKDWVGDVVDSVCLFTLVAGMAASLGAGILTLAGGIAHLTPITSNWKLWVVIGILIVVTFVVSAASGLQRGIRYLSQINVAIFFAIILFVFGAGPTQSQMQLTAYAVWDFMTQLPQRVLLTDFASGDPWAVSWTLFYWCNWLAWAPVSAVFLGRISKGYTLRQMLLFVWILPSIFGTIWMGVLGGTSISFDLAGKGLSGILKENGPEAVSYAIFADLPLSALVIPLFLVAVFISYVTAADSNTMAMAGLCSTGISPDSPEPPLNLKLIWGGVVGAVSLVMICSTGVEGVKTLSNLGGMPAMIFEILATICLLKLVFQFKKS